MPKPPSPAAPPAFPAPAPAEALAPSLGRRFACWMYEGVLVFGVVWISAYLFGSLSQSRHALQNRTGLQVFIFVVLGIYFVWFWAKGQTLAMKTWHIRVVGRDLRGISQPRALARYVLSWLWVVPPLALASVAGWPAAYGAVLLLGWIPFYALLARFHRDRQYLHDALAGTQLIDVRPGRTVPRG